MPDLEDEAPPRVTCPACGGVATKEDGINFKCRDCGTELTHEQYLEHIASRVRANGFENVADRLDAAVRRMKEVES